ncbi:MAG: ERAP1-like C-terminal domain-containing protein, partial [Deltaproteobacteria bacterium]|nr:ERAP1-like C-terminal domain-containing protein [Deltaproteobacteria bacterium]
YMGKPNFREGLRSYLKEHEYGCAASHDLWKAFEAVSERPIIRIAKSWIEQPGFPIVEVERREGRLFVSQTRFTYLPHESRQEWLIPLTVRLFYEHGKTELLSTLLEGKEQVVEIGMEPVAYKVNDRQMGFYRVRYRDRKDLGELGRRVLAKDLLPEDRWGLQNDLYALVRRGDVPIGDYLNFLSYYEEEDSFLPLAGMDGNLFQAFLVAKETEKEKIRSLTRSMFQRTLSEIGFEPRPGEKHTMSVLRDRIIWHSAIYGSTEVEGFARDKFESLMRGEAVHPDILKSVMQVGALNGHDRAFHWLTRKFLVSESEHERMNLLAALGCFRETPLIEKAREFVLESVPSRNRFIPIVSMALNPYAVDSMWDWYVSNLERLEQFHPMHYERVIEAIVPVGGIGREEEVRAFFEDYMKKKELARDVIRLSLEKLEIHSRMHHS